MNRILIDIYNFLTVRDAEVPLPFGKYHLSWIIAVVLITVALILLFSRASEKTTRTVIASAWAVMLTMELTKQLINCMTVSADAITWRYNFGAFPYHFCSTPLYVLPMAAFMKDGHKRNTAIVFLSTFAVIGGVAIYLAPDSVLLGHKFVDFQSMLHHGIQIFIGIYLAVRYRPLLTGKNFWRATHAFLFMTYLAILLNVMFMNIFNITGIGSTINLFFVNPYVRYIPPVLEGLGLEKLPYLVFLFGYLTIFISISYLLMKALSFLNKKSI